MDDKFNELAFGTLKIAVEVAKDSMIMSIARENYNEFFETFGEIYTILSNEFRYATKNKTGYHNKIYNLIYDELIFNSVNIMKNNIDDVIETIIKIKDYD